MMMTISHNPQGTPSHLGPTKVIRLLYGFYLGMGLDWVTYGLAHLAFLCRTQKGFTRAITYGLILGIWYGSL